MTHAINEVSIRELNELPEHIHVLQAQAMAEGFRFLTRLIVEWESQFNRFEQSGECLLGVFCKGQLVGIGGVSRDPQGDPNMARLRRLYVTPAMRGRGIGKQLVEQLLARAAAQFSTVRLSTDTFEGQRFYLCCGFHAIDDASATHEKSLRKSSAPSPSD